MAEINVKEESDEIDLYQECFNNIKQETIEPPIVNNDLNTSILTNQDPLSSK